jgi:hypothetical protein
MHDLWMELPRGRARRSNSLGAFSVRGRMLGGIHASLFLLAVLGVGCKGPKSPSLADPVDATITAVPNPVPAQTGKGTTQISWNTGDGSPGQVYVARDGKPEQLFSQGAKGSQEAPWIRAGLAYEFRLYAGKEHAQLLASVAVRGEKKSQNPNPKIQIPNLKSDR